MESVSEDRLKPYLNGDSELEHLNQVNFRDQ